MKDTTERRLMIIERVCECRHISMTKLATEFQVSHRTIENDIQMLSRLYPIYTTTGIYGGVHVVDGFRFGMKYFTESQIALLEKLSESLAGDDLTVMRDILKTFKKPS